MGKQYAILRVQKCKGAEIGAMQYHNDREPGKHTNPDIDQSRTRMNRELCPHADYEGEVQARIDAGYKGTRKVRKDAVRLVEGIVTASPEFFEGASAEEVRDFFEDALGFCREEFYRHEDPRGRAYFWLTGDFVNGEPGAEDTDEWALAHGYVSIVPVQVDLTDYRQLAALANVLE